MIYDFLTPEEIQQVINALVISLQAATGNAYAARQISQELRYWVKLDEEAARRAGSDGDPKRGDK